MRNDLEGNNLDLENYVEHIILSEYLHGHSEISEQVIHKFLEKFITGFSKDYLEFLSAEDIIQFSLSRFEFFSSRDIEHKTASGVVYPQVDIIAAENNPLWLANATLIEIVVDDCPFIVRTLTDLITQKGIKIRWAIHPVFYLKRKNGILNKISSIPGEDLVHESYTVFAVDLPNDIEPQDKDKFITDLKAEIIKTMIELQFVSCDFEQMKKLILSENPYKNQPQSPAEKQLVQWLIESNFIFLSMFHEEDVSRRLGLFNPDAGEGYALNLEQVHTEKEIGFCRVELFHRVKRRRQLIAIQFADKTVITGLFTRRAENIPHTEIPVTADATERFVHHEKPDFTSLDKKEFFNALDYIPLAFRFSENIKTLYPLAQSINKARLRNEGQVTLVKSIKETVLCILMWPIEEFDDDLLNSFYKTLEASQAQIVFRQNRSLSGLVLYFFEVKFNEPVDNDLLINMQEKLSLAVLDWDATFMKLAEKEFEGNRINKVKKLFLPSLPEEYRARHVNRHMLDEFLNIDALGENEEIRIDIVDDRDNQLSRLKLYSKSDYSLSFLIPLFDDYGIEVFDEEKYILNYDNETRYIYRFFIKTGSIETISEDLKNRLVEALHKSLAATISSEPLNRLICTGGLNVYQLQLLKALISYLFQLKPTLSRINVKNSLIENPALSKGFITRFEMKFAAAILADDSSDSTIKIIEKTIPWFKESFEQSKEQAQQLINEEKIENLYQHEMVTNINNMIDAMVRTDYFRHDEQITFKVKSDEITFLANPRPFYEIWVYHSYFEAVHLRGGMVARGGLRWSDRISDFRTEVLGLWKAQVLKNTVIIPTGSKGGFVLKYKNFTRENAVWAYKIFMRSMIGISDNREQGKVVTGKLIAKTDGEDTYLVVAADKGTATFSDYANSVSVDMGFWLQDAYASGGKTGYSHKALGITAKGAWESARWHFYSMGKDPAVDSFTAVAIGDLSGDVFGNGVLLSDKYKLIAAFNHKHIFIDPNPDEAESFQERKKVFELGRSSWRDYNSAVISPGGAIYDRDAAEITISEQAAQALSVSKTTFSGEQLIQAILQADVDMLFNGGIGTYIKSSEEGHDAAGDHNNDRVRIDADRLRVKMVIEGGNLGVTMKGRMQYAASGGLIYTDALDNSAGVDLSDHEVNLKILLNLLKDDKLLNSEEERNHIIESLSEEMMRLVLKNNFRQNMVLARYRHVAGEDVYYLQEAINFLEKQGFIDRSSLAIPEQATLQKMLTSEDSVPTTLMANILASVKLYAQKFADEISSEFYEEYIYKYFPETISQYHDQMKRHPLAAEIGQTMVINEVIDQAGLVYVEKCRQLLNLGVSQSITQYLTVNEIFDFNRVRQLPIMPDIETRSFASSEKFDVVNRISEKIEGALFRLVEMQVLFPVDENIIAEKVKKNMYLMLREPSDLDKPEIEFLQPLPEEVINIIREKSSYVEPRYLVAFVLSNEKQENFDSFSQFYFSNQLHTLKKTIYGIAPENRWQIHALIDLKKKFWLAIKDAFENNRQLRSGINLKDETVSLSSSSKIDIASLSGLIEYMFQ